MLRWSNLLRTLLTWIELRANTESGYDFVYVFTSDGTQVVKLDGEQQQFSGLAARVQFTSDGSTTADGWRLERTGCTQHYTYSAAIAQL